MDSLQMMRDSLIRERMGLVAELIDGYRDPSLPALWQFAEMLVDEKTPPLKPPNGRSLDKRFLDTWFAVHEAWFIHNHLNGEVECLRSKK